MMTQACAENEREIVHHAASDTRDGRGRVGLLLTNQREVDFRLFGSHNAIDEAACGSDALVAHLKRNQGAERYSSEAAEQHAFHEESVA